MGRESWFFSWALDTGNEEREKGITVECGQAFFETDRRRYTLLDAPGHKNYVPSMISGANQADVAMLVISARKGEFETGFEKGGQTREHATLVKTAGVKRLVVAVNKMDEPTVKWDKARYDEIVEKVSPFLRQCGFNLKTDVTFMPVSGYTGANLKEPLTKETCPWYDGPSLLQFLDNMPSLDRRLTGPFLMPITGKFREMGTIITGKIESGRVAKGDNLLIMPNKVSMCSFHASAHSLRYLLKFSVSTLRMPKSRRPSPAIMFVFASRVLRRRMSRSGLSPAVHPTRSRPPRPSRPSS